MFFCGSCRTIQVRVHIREHLAASDQAECHRVFSSDRPIVIRLLPVPQWKALRLLHYDPGGTCAGRVWKRKLGI